MIETLGDEHVEQVAELHMRTLTGLVAQLGAFAVKAYYGGTVSAKDAIGLVDVTGSHVNGFVFGSRHPERLMQQIATRNPIKLAIAVTTGFVADPTAVAWFVRSFRGPQEGAYDRRAPSLIYLAIAPQARRAGLGRELVTAFGARVRSAGATYYDLSVDEDNTAAITFYERLGFHLISRYREFALWHRRYRMNLS
jgi:ribosomal protein S18 acetylase RimI-like enzyme